MKTIAVIDTETTGFDPTCNSIVELAVVLLTEDGTILKSFSSLVKPAHPISYEAMAVHHLTESMVADAPSLTEVLLLASTLVDQDPNYFVAHYAQFDSQFLPWLSPWICTARLACHLWPEAPAHSNGVLRYWLPGLNDEIWPPPDIPHRAGSDALVTAHILRRMLQLHPIEYLLELSPKPIFFKTVKFGMYRGKPWEEVPSKYLQWMLRQTDFDPDTRATVRYHLERLNNGQQNQQ